MSNGLFGGADLIDDEPKAGKKGGASKLNSIFDYEDEGEEEKFESSPA